MRAKQKGGNRGIGTDRKLRWGCSKQTGASRPCTCAMGNVSRFIEPVVLRILKNKKRSYGYEIADCLADYALTDATIEGAALYRTLRTLEANRHLRSTWEAGAGPARRSYALTPRGEQHLDEWNRLLKELGAAMIRFAQGGESRAEASCPDPGQPSR